MILVAGGTGHLGSELVPLLSGRGQAVRVLTRDAGRARRVLGEAVELVEGDATDPRSLVAAMKGVETVVSAVTGFGPGGAGPARVDHLGNTNLIRAAEAAGVSHFVLLSMVGASADHPLELLRMKHRAELTLRASGLAWTIVRPTVFMELWAGIVGDPIVSGGSAVVFGRGDNPVNFISAGDLARFVDLALRDPRLRGEAIDVGGPDNLTFNQLVRSIEAESGRHAAVRHLPVPVMRFASAILRPFRPDLAGMIQAGVLTDTGDMAFDATELERRFPEVVLTTMSQVLQRRFGPAGKVAADPRTPMPERPAHRGSAQATTPPPEAIGGARS